MNDISIDLETLSTRQDAAILSIGAAEFNRNTGEIGRQFYVEVDIDSAIEDVGGHVLGTTLCWWMRQSDRAKELFAEDRTKVKLWDALAQLTKFVGQSDPCPWGNGASFDISVLEHAYSKTMCVGAPWKFWKIRDMRTIVDIAATFGFDKASIPFHGTAHNALDDAIHQARVISACWRVATLKDFPRFAAPIWQGADQCATGAPQTSAGEQA